MDALAVAAAEAGGPAAKEFDFVVFVGHRRRLAPDDELFEAGNIEREALARQARRRLLRVLHCTRCLPAAAAACRGAASHLHRPGSQSDPPSGALYRRRWRRRATSAASSARRRGWRPTRGCGTTASNVPRWALN